jgi:hypothetical protein
MRPVRFGSVKESSETHNSVKYQPKRLRPVPGAPMAFEKLRSKILASGAVTGASVAG